MKPSFKHFNQLTDKDINIDYHIHTNQTDGHDSIDTIIKESLVKGLKGIAFTEHVRTSSDWFSEFADNVREAASHHPNIEVLVGAETKALDYQGGLDITVETLTKSDIILGSVHRIPDGKGGAIKFTDLKPRELAEIEFELARGMLKHSPIDVLAHPGGVYSLNHGAFPTRYFKELMYYAKVNDKAIEFSSRYLKNHYDFLSLCGEISPLVSIGSDVHNAKDIGSCRDTLHKFEYKTFQRRP